MDFHSNLYPYISLPKDGEELGLIKAIISTKNGLWVIAGCDDGSLKLFDAQRKILQ